MHSLEFRDASLRYEAQRGKAAGLLALDSLNLCVGEGESVAIIGPSGCGKSSTLRMAAGLLKPTSGSVLLDGEPIERPRRQTALILQDFGLLPWKTVQANAELGLKVRGVGRADRSRKASEALELVGLLDFARAYPEELSGGMKQRLALARALALDIDLLLMDEPLSALDALLREQMQDLLLDLWKRSEYAQILVTHSIDEAVYLGQRIVVLSPRPGHVVSVKENPSVGKPQYRGTVEFFELCTEIRGVLRDAACEGGFVEEEVSMHA